MRYKPVRHFLIITVFALSLSVICGPAFAMKVSDMTVDVANHQGKFVGDNLIDGNSATAWVGGGKGIGPGKWIELYFPSPVALESLRIHNGNQGNGQFNKFRSVIKGVVLYPDETRQKFTLKPTSGAQTIKLKPVTAGSIKIIITGVAPSSKDKSIGKAKVAVSEIAVFGTPVKGEERGLTEPDDGGAAMDDEAEVDEPEAKPEPEVEAVKKAEPASAPEPEQPTQTTKTEKKKVEPAPEAKAAPKPATKKPEPKPKKATPKNKVAPRKKVKAPSADKITRMRVATAIPADKPVVTGVISPWLDIEFVAQIKRYFALLTTLHDSYPEVFTSDIRERERKEFIRLQDDMRKSKLFGQHHIAMLESFGLGFDKPIVKENTAEVRVHGLYRYYLENDAFEFPVDTLFSFKKENGKWLISGVQGK